MNFRRLNTKILTFIMAVSFVMASSACADIKAVGDESEASFILYREI